LSSQWVSPLLLQNYHWVVSVYKSFIDWYSINLAQISQKTNSQSCWKSIYGHRCTENFSPGKLHIYKFCTNSAKTVLCAKKIGAWQIGLRAVGRMMEERHAHLYSLPVHPILLSAPVHTMDRVNWWQYQFTSELVIIKQHYDSLKERRIVDNLYVIMNYKNVSTAPLKLIVMILVASLVCTICD
jgi:hypothetical protein